MRCQSCDKNLNDWESTHKHPVTDEYTDMCAKCLNVIQQTAIVNEHDFTTEFEYEEAEQNVKKRDSTFDYYEGDWDDYD